MDDNIAIKVKGVNKVFKLPLEKQNSVKGVLISFMRGGKRRYQKQQALKNISFEVKKGEFFGIVGRNGSGKSTLLKMLAGIYSPTAGTIHINGKLTPFIELGVGFNPELTGRENIFLNGALLGFNRKEMLEMYESIVAFAELKDFMDQKLKNYSSGMQVRLAFSIAIRAKSDILLIDEVLAVGDVLFQEKCFDVFRSMKRDGRTVIFVSHDLAGIQEFCDRAILIDRGVQVNIGEPEKIVMEYETLMSDDRPTSAVPPQTDRPGSGKYRIRNVELLNSNDKPAKSIREGEMFSLQIGYTQKTAINELICGISINDADGISIMGPNTAEARVKLTQNDLKVGNSIKAVFSNNVLSPGIYSVTIGLFANNNSNPVDFFSNAITFKIIGKVRHGKITIEPEWSVIKTSN